MRMARQAARDLRGEPEVGRSAAPCLSDLGTGHLHWTPRCALRLGLAGGTARLLSGLLRVGGGFVLVPRLPASRSLS